MTTIHTLTGNFIYTLFLCSAMSTASAQDNKTTPAMPERPKFNANIREVNVTAIDNVVSLSFNLLRSVDDITSKLGVLENQLQGGIPDPSLMLTQADECSSALGNVGTSAPALIEDLANMISNIQSLHVPVLKIPHALKNLNEARKAVQYSVGCAQYLIVNAIPTIKQKTSSAASVLVSQN